jgi:hypothetical protein
LIDQLWTELENKNATPDARLRAACALASYDSANDRWHNSNRDVAGMLVSVNIVYLRQWKESLLPIHAVLLDPLTDIFRYRQRSELERSIATSVLADYAADHPQRLAMLLSDADVPQFDAIFSVLRRHEQRAVSQLEAILDLTPAPKWVDPTANPSWQTVAPSDVQVIQQAHGMLHQHFAYCQDMQLERFLEVASRLSPAGYRPIRFCPFVVDGSVLVAAVWTRDGGKWHIEPKATLSIIEKKKNELKNQGFMPLDITPYLVTSGVDTDKRNVTHYAVLWGKADDDFVDSRFEFGVMHQSEQQLASSLAQQGFRRSSHFVFTENDGKKILSGEVVTS